MDAKQKPRDMRDDVYAPHATKTDIDEKLAGAPSAAVPPKAAAKPAVKGASVTPGQATEG